jgi:hypothetical protein
MWETLDGEGLAVTIGVVISMHPRNSIDYTGEVNPSSFDALNSTPSSLPKWVMRALTRYKVGKCDEAIRRSST